MNVKGFRPPVGAPPSLFFKVYWGQVARCEADHLRQSQAEVKYTELFLHSHICLIAQWSAKQRDNIVLTCITVHQVRSSSSSITSSAAPLSFITVMHVPLLAGPSNISSWFIEEVSVSVHLHTYIPMVRGSEIGKDAECITEVCCFFPSTIFKNHSSNTTKLGVSSSSVTLITDTVLCSRLSGSYHNHFI